MKHLRLAVIPAALIIASMHIAWSAVPNEQAAAGDHLFDPVAFDSLQLRPADLPKGHALATTDYTRSIQAASLYDDAAMYAPLIGNVAQKSRQSIDGSDMENGTILYFRFDKRLADHAFIDALIWGEDGKPTDEHPEEILVKDNVIVILSFAKGSDVGKQMKELMMKRLGL
jgi:hypothetical protein